MIKIPYYVKQRITKRATDIVMVILLIITLFPIFWMVFCSFKSNTEILLGKIPFGKASNDAIAIESRGKYLYIMTSDGGISKVDPEKDTILKHDSIKSMATNWLVDEENIWASTADKGLVQIAINDFGKKRYFDINDNNIDPTKVVTTFMLKDGKFIWIGLQQKNIEKIYKFDKDEMKFSGEMSFASALSPSIASSISKIGNVIYLGTNKGILGVDTYTEKAVKTIDGAVSGIPPIAIKKLVLNGGNFLAATESGLYMISPYSGAVIKRWGQESGLLSDRINNLEIDGKNIFVGTNGGLSVIDSTSFKIKNYEKLFHPVEGSTEKELVNGDVFAIIRSGNGIILGSSSGRISNISLDGNYISAFKVSDGHVLVRWRNYVDLWKNINFGLYLKNSLIICGITMVLAMIFATLAAYSLARFNFPGNQFFSVGVLATQMIPAIMYLIPIYIMFTKFTQMTGVPMKGTYAGMILIYSAFFIPFSIWILRGFFASIPVELEEAARIDGCSPFQVFWYIVLPLAVPGIIATGIYVFLTAWDELMFAWVLCSADTMTIPVGIRLFVGNYQNRFDLMMAAATVATIPVMILFFMLQKYIVKGLTAGAVKG